MSACREEFTNRAGHRLLAEMREIDRQDGRDFRDVPDVLEDACGATSQPAG